MKLFENKHVKINVRKTTRKKPWVVFKELLQLEQKNAV